MNYVRNAWYVAAEARLINDNLLDFSHLSYVHANSFGASEDWARDRPQITMLPRGVRVERWVPAQSGFRSRGGPPVDAWSTYDFLLPGILLMPSASYPAGTAERCGFAAPDPAIPATGVTFTSQAVTPLTARTARYFFMGPAARLRRRGDARHADGRRRHGVRRGQADDRGAATRDRYDPGSKDHADQRG